MSAQLELTDNQRRRMFAELTRRISAEDESLLYAVSSAGTGGLKTTAQTEASATRVNALSAYLSDRVRSPVKWWANIAMYRLGMLGKRAPDKVKTSYGWHTKGLVSVAVLVLLAGCQQINWLDDPKWDHAPITVDWSADLNDVMPWAMDSWNHAAGCTVAVRAHGTPDVTFGPYDGTACGRPAQLEATGDAVAGAWRCSPTHAEVHFKVLSDIRSNGIAATHEMGHVLGLAHDRSALMQAAPQLYHPEQLSGNSGLLPWPSEADGAAVGKRYCR